MVEGRQGAGWRIRLPAEGLGWRRRAHSAAAGNLRDGRFGARSGRINMASDEEVGRQILSIFIKHNVAASGVLRRNHFIDVRDGDFQRGLNKAVENHWIKIKLRDRYTYELTEAGLAEGLNAGLPLKPLV